MPVWWVGSWQRFWLLGLALLYVCRPELLWWVLTKMAKSHLQPLYIADVGSWWLLISQISIGWLQRGETKAVRPVNGVISLYLNPLLFDSHPWLVGFAPTVWGFFFPALRFEKEWVEWGTHWYWQPAELLADVHGICERILLCSPFTAKNPQILLRGLIQICTLNSEHLIPSQRYGDQNPFPLKVSLDYLQWLVGWSTYVICAQIERFWYSTCLLEIS